MYKIISEFLSDKKGGEIFLCFGVWHLVYIIIALALGLSLILFLKNKSADIKNKTTLLVINLAFGLYVSDFFLMPFAYGEIDIEKLPFHICTVSCVMCFVSRHWEKISKYRKNIAMLAFISNLVYLIYPAGVMWHSVHPLSYRVWQTLLFHGIMTVYGLLMLIFDDGEFCFKKSYRDLAVLGGVTLWAVIGNALYNGNVGEYNHFFNWFFVVRDPFYLFPENISPYIMPFINISLFFIVECLIYGVVFWAFKCFKNKKQI